MKRGKQAMKRKQRLSVFQELADTVKAAHALISNEDVDALVEGNETCATLVQAAAAQERLYYATLEQRGHFVSNKQSRETLAKQILVMGDMAMRAFALGLREGRGETQVTAEESDVTPTTD